jgi:hypothetical protein
MVVAQETWHRARDQSCAGKNWRPVTQSDEFEKGEQKPFVDYRLQ